MLRQYGVRPQKALGQSFMTNRQAVQRVLEAASLTGSETVLEIGPGLGALTWQLSQLANRVIAIEFDRQLLPPLQALLSGLPNVELHQDDILTVPWERLGLAGPYCVVANIPYSITSAVLRRLLESQMPAEWLVLTLQREVAERVVAEPGMMSLLALSVQLYGTPRLAARIPPDAFYPRPKVESTVLRVDVHRPPRVEPSLVEPVFRLARAGFGQRRKQLRNALAAGLGIAPAQAAEWLQATGVRPERRAQALSVEDWLQLAAHMSALGANLQGKRAERPA